MSSTLTAYLAAEGFLSQLQEELAEQNIVGMYGDLVLVEGDPVDSVWALNIWQDARWMPIESVSDAAKQLKAIQRNWVPYSYHLHRRVSLVKEQLPFISDKPRTFPCVLPEGKLGAFTLVEQNLMLAAPVTSSHFPGGNPNFAEDHENPPSRAYLKLWEALLRFGEWPASGEKCLELGASPGGWTWVLANLGAHVTAVDRSELDAKLMRRPNVKFQAGDAFQWLPKKAGDIAWVFSDVICYPEKLYDFVKEWTTAPSCKAMICTIKLQGAARRSVIQPFIELPDSRVHHLFHNKNELTWLWRNPRGN